MLTRLNLLVFACTRIAEGRVYMALRKTYDPCKDRLFSVSDGCTTASDAADFQESCLCIDCEVFQTSTLDHSAANKLQTSP
jgi:hypothetical protein